MTPAPVDLGSRFPPRKMWLVFTNCGAFCGLHTQNEKPSYSEKYEVTEIVTATEHEALLREARAEAFEEAANLVKGALPEYVIKLHAQAKAAREGGSGE